MDIIRLGHRMTEGVLNIGDEIVVWEKIDGANAAFQLNDPSLTYVNPYDYVRKFSRNNELVNGGDTLRGFAGWVDSNVKMELLNPRYKYYGEWLVPHSMKYPEHRYHQFYLFDVYDESRGIYLDDIVVVMEAARLGLKIAPILYKGEYQGYDHLMSFVGQTRMGGESGEGIVVKKYNYRDPYGNQLFIKLVADAFREIRPQKAPKDPNAYDEVYELMASLATPARIGKLVYKLIDAGMINELWELEDMGTILKNIGVYEDIMKEEADSIPNRFDDKAIRKALGSIVPKVLKDILREGGVL